LKIIPFDTEKKQIFSISISSLNYYNKFKTSHLLDILADYIYLLDRFIVDSDNDKYNNFKWKYYQTFELDQLILINDFKNVYSNSILVTRSFLKISLE